MRTQKLGMLVCLLAVGAFASQLPAAITVNGDASDWAGIIVNLDAVNNPNNLDVKGWGAVVDITGGKAYFASKFEYDMRTYFHTSGAWVNFWIDVDNNDESGHGGGQLTANGWETKGIDIAVELENFNRSLPNDPFRFYYSNGSDCPKEQYPGGYPSCSGSFAVSADGLFFECWVPISELIATAVANQAVDPTVYGEIDEDAAATGLWEVGIRHDGRDATLGITWGAKYEGLVDLPVIPGDANLNGYVDDDDLRAI